MTAVATGRIEHGPAPADDPPILSHQFDDVDQQSEASALGMWLFLATEVMFFGGLLTAFAVYRGIVAPREVALASRHLNVPLGCLNTVVLVGSSPPVTQAALVNPSWSTNGFTVSVSTQCGRVYALEYKDSVDSDWTPLPLFAGTGKLLPLVDARTLAGQRFYRVRRW